MPPVTVIRALPWRVLFELASTAKAHLDEHLSAADRREVAAIFRASKGDVRKLSAGDRDALRRIARKLELAKLARTAGPTALRLRGGGRRRRP